MNERHSLDPGYHDPEARKAYLAWIDEVYQQYIADCERYHAERAGVSPIPDAIRRSWDEDER